MPQLLPSLLMVLGQGLYVWPDCRNASSVAGLVKLKSKKELSGGTCELLSRSWLSPAVVGIE